MTDTRAQPPDKSSDRVPKAEEGMATDRAVASWGFGVALYLLDHYRQQLVERVLPYPTRFDTNPKRLSSDIARLSKPTAHGLLILLWRLQFGGKGVAGSGPTRSVKGVITRNSLGKVLELDSGEPPAQTLSKAEREKRAAKYVRSASRIIEAAITFGLIEELPARTLPVKCKPLRGTDKLDKLMTALGVNYAVRLRAALEDGGPKSGKAAGRPRSRKGGSKK